MTAAGLYAANLTIRREIPSRHIENSGLFGFPMAVRPTQFVVSPRTRRHNMTFYRVSR
jgi:hypothetical protein